MQDAIIGLDIGTTCTKAVLVSLSGDVLANAERYYGLSTPHTGWVEQDPQVVWEAAVQAVRTVMGQAGTGARPLALAVACQSGSLMPVDTCGAPVYPCITWMDGRSQALVDDWLLQGVGPQVRQVTGWHVHPGLPLATLAWFRAQRADICARARRWLTMNDFIVHRLTGQYCTNPSNGSVTQLMDIVTAGWSPELCVLAGIRPEQLSDVEPSGAMIGPLTKEASVAMGLPDNTLVINGGHDQSCTALALGAVMPGQVLLASGTSWVVTAITEEVDVAGAPNSLDLNFHTAPGLWTMSQSLGGLGAALEWLLNQGWHAVASRAERFASLDRELQTTRPGSDGLLFMPITGGHTGPTGVRQGGFLNVRLQHTRAHLARAIMEGAVFEVRLVLEQMRCAGWPSDHLLMVGGATRSSIWPGIVANVTGLPTRAAQSTYLTAMGAAILAGWGAGVFPSLAAAQVCFAQPEIDIAPDAAAAASYKQQFITYSEMLKEL